MKKRDTKTAALSRQPGRFPKVDLEKPFAHRVRKRAAEGKLHQLLANAIAANQEETIRLAGLAIGTLHLLLGKAKTQVSKSAFKKSSVKDAQAAVSRLLDTLREAAPQALSARVVLEDGRLRADAPPEEQPDQRNGLNADKQAYLYPSHAILNPLSTVVRLYK